MASTPQEAFRGASALFYNGVHIDVARVLGFSAKPIYLGHELAATKYTLAVEGWINPQTCAWALADPTNQRGAPRAVNALGLANPGTPATTAAETYHAIRWALQQPRKNLLYVVEGKTVLRSPWHDYTRGELSVTDMIQDLPSRRSQGVDDANGPIVESINIPFLLGARTWPVQFVVSTTLNECHRHSADTRTQKSVLAHHWEQDLQVDQDFHTIRVIKGEALFSSAGLATFLRNGQRGLPTDLIRALAHPVLANFKRDHVEINQSNDGLRLKYVIVDRERSIGIPSQYASGARAGERVDVTRIEATHHFKFVSPGFEGALGGVVSGVGTMVGAAAGAVANPMAAPQAGALIVGGFLDAAKSLINTVPRIAHVVQVKVWGHPASRRLSLTNIARDILFNRVDALQQGLRAVLGGATLEVLHDLPGKFAHVGAVFLGGIIETLADTGVAFANILRAVDTDPWFGKGSEDGSGQYLVDSRTATVTNPVPVGDGLLRGRALFNLVYPLLRNGCDLTPRQDRELQPTDATADGLAASFLEGEGIGPAKRGI